MDQERERARLLQRASLSPSRQTDLRKRSRSVSSYSSSSDSVSTISTNRSLSPKKRRRSQQDDYLMSQEASNDQFLSEARQRKRRRSFSRSSSDSIYSRDDKRSTHQRRRRQTISPHSRGRPLESGRRRSRSRSKSFDQSRVAKARKSMAPASPQQTHHFEDVSKRPRETKSSAAFNRKNEEARISQANRSSQGRSGILRERSLSPYSRRLALTQAMNLER